MNVLPLTHAGLPNRSTLADMASLEEGRRLRYQMSSMTAYERHKMLINHYVLYHPGSTAFLQRDTSVPCKVSSYHIFSHSLFCFLVIFSCKIRKTFIRLGRTRLFPFLFIFLLFFVLIFGSILLFGVFFRHSNTSVSTSQTPLRRTRLFTLLFLCSPFFP